MQPWPRVSVQSFVVRGGSMRTIKMEVAIAIDWVARSIASHGAWDLRVAIPVFATGIAMSFACACG